MSQLSFQHVLNKYRELSFSQKDKGARFERLMQAYLLTDHIYAILCIALRGNQRTSGELSRKEGGKIFGSGSRTPIAVTLLVKNSKAVEHDK